MAWCEMNQVDFVFGLARNARLVEEISVELLQAEAEASATGKPARRFKDFRYATLDSWSAPAPGRRQGGMDKRRGQSALHRHLVEQGRDERPLSL